jgi:enamine deaminase RidA (YjgF/YER057c/UK114 family)
MATLNLMACSSNYTIKRTHVADFEQQIGFTQVLEHGGHLYISGIAEAGPDMEQAVNQAYSRLSEILHQHGSSMGNVVKELIYTTNIEAMKAQIETRKKYYPENQYPASSWVEVKSLFLPELILEVEVEAVIDFDLQNKRTNNNLKTQR